MASILRVKRKKHEEPSDALLIACKRQKVLEDLDEATPLTAIAKFAGTVENHADNVVEHVNKTLHKDALQATYKQHLIDVTAKIRERLKKESAEKRYKVVNHFRSMNKEPEVPGEDVVNVIDIEKHSADALPSSSETEEDEHVYDLYYLKTEDDLDMDTLLSVHPCEQELVFETYNDNDPETECRDDSEDSNSESNWKNDYPEESDHSADSIGENEIRAAVMDMNLDDDNQLSSDEDIAYALNKKDVDLYGHKYAEYKARMKRERGDIDSDHSHSDNSANEPESEDSFYECDSDEGEKVEE